MVWLLSTLTVTNVWSGDCVADFTTCESAASNEGSVGLCPDKLCVLTKSAEGEVSRVCHPVAAFQHHACTSGISPDASLTPLSLS